MPASLLSAASWPTSASAPFVHQAQAATFDVTAPGKKWGRERVITFTGAQAGPYTTASAAVISSSGLPVEPLAPLGPPPASSPSISWCASTGQHELNQRQLELLREMLGSAPRPAGVAEREGVQEAAALRVDRDWRWSDTRKSMITLPVEEDGGASGRCALREHTHRAGGRVGMVGIRDILRALKRCMAAPDTVHRRRAAQSTTSLNKWSSMDSCRHR